MKNTDGIEALVTILKTLPQLRESDLQYVADALTSIIELRKYYQFENLKLKASF